MKAMFAVLCIGGAVAIVTGLSAAESVRAFTPFAVLSTGVLLLAYWVVAADRTPSHATTDVHKEAA
jgi:hypothetical protein